MKKVQHFLLLVFCSFFFELACIFMKEMIYAYDCESASLTNEDDYLARYIKYQLASNLLILLL